MFTNRLHGRRRTLVFESLESRQLLAADNMSLVPFWDGETVDPSGPLLNRFGGNPLGGVKAASISYETTTVRSGKGGFRIDTNAPIPEHNFDAVGISLTGFGQNEHYVDTRDLSRFDEVRFWLNNTTDSEFNFIFEIKDYRDSLLHRARREYPIDDTAGWTPISVPLDLTEEGWDVTGSPDLTRARIFAFVLETKDTPVDGSIYLDEMIFVEKGGALNPQAADFNLIVDRLIERQFGGLWGSRDRQTGLMPGISSHADVMALNSTAGLLHMLPTAIEQQWCGETEANDYVSLVVGTLNTIWNEVEATGNGGYVPPRYVDRVTLLPTNLMEESSVDAALLFLALHRYRSLPTTPADVRLAIDGLLGRFNFAAFSKPGGWSLAYRYADAAFTQGTYDGYSTEVYVISLAAHLAPNNRVDIATHWNSAVNRVEDHLADAAESHLVHTYHEFRAPFLQWLFPLLVDVRGRGADTYPDATLAGNPFWNAVLYQREAYRKLEALGRSTFAQPDAGDDNTDTYAQFSLYHDFGQPDLFMPWSSSYGPLAAPTSAEAAMRDLLARDLHGPLGLSDSVQFATGADRPISVAARHDFWNVTLSTWALLQYRHGVNRSLASLPEVAVALDAVLPEVLPRGALPQALASSRNWIAFTPRHYNPNIGQFPSEAQLRADLQQLYDDGWRGIVTYTLDGTLQHVPRIAKELGFASVIAGLFWFDNSQLAREKAVIPAVDPFVDAYVMGNEGLLEGRYSRAALELEIAALRAQTGKPVTTTETGGQYLADPTLLDVGDWVFPNVQPFCADPPIRDVAAAVQHASNEYLAIRDRAQSRTAGRLVVLKESWWPTAGDAAASESHQAEYFRQLADTPALFVWGESFDQPWKFEPACGNQGPHWGLYEADGSCKALVPRLHTVYASYYADAENFDSDGDGITDVVEMDAPNSGDGNRDGIPDYLQANAASFRGGAKQVHVTLAAPEGTLFRHVASVPIPSPGDVPQGLEFPAGFFQFELVGIAAGGAVTVEMSLTPYAEINTYYRHGPTPTNPTPHWYRFLSKSATGAELLVDRGLLHLVDGARGDDDLTADGVVRDAGGPAADQRPYPWHNPNEPLDVDDDGRILPLDALLLINELNQYGSRTLPVPPTAPDVAYKFLDCVPNNMLVPLDALLIINYLNGQPPLQPPAEQSGIDGDGSPGETGDPEGECARAHPCRVLDEWFATQGDWASEPLAQPGAYDNPSTFRDQFATPPAADPRLAKAAPRTASVQLRKTTPTRSLLDDDLSDLDPLVLESEDPLGDDGVTG